MTIGILALQGAFIEHQHMLDKMNVSSFFIRNKEDLKHDMDGLILPGGESTTMRNLLETLDLYTPIYQLIKDGLPTLGTCAGMILLAEKVENDPINHFSLMPMTVKRNAYGRQLGSFYTHNTFNGVKIPMVFIRAPYVTEVGDGVKILSQVDGHIVAVQYQHIIATAFHPELSDDHTVLDYLIRLIEST